MIVDDDDDGWLGELTAGADATIQRTREEAIYPLALNTFDDLLIQIRLTKWLRITNCINKF
jgi:hypothetical protein